MSTPCSSSTTTSKGTKRSRVKQVLSSIAENLAHETCVSKIDAAYPTGKTA